MNWQIIISLLAGVFIVYRLFQRVRRTFSWQPLRLGKLRTFTVIFGVIGLLFLVEGAFHTTSLISDLIGAVLGAILAYYAAGLTRFELHSGQWSYRTNVWIGGLVTLLFLGRLVYRIFDMVQSGGFSQGMDWTSRFQAMDSSWTAGLMLIMFSYYVTYNLIIISKQKQLQIT